MIYGNLRQSLVAEGALSVRAETAKEKFSHTRTQSSAGVPTEQGLHAFVSHFTCRSCFQATLLSCLLNTLTCHQAAGETDIM